MTLHFGSTGDTESEGREEQHRSLGGSGGCVIVKSVGIIANITVETHKLHTNISSTPWLGISYSMKPQSVVSVSVCSISIQNNTAGLLW